LLGMPETTVFKDIESPFHKDQIDLRIITNISTRQSQRQNSLSPISERIGKQYHIAPGNYLVYLSSFEYLNAIHDCFAKQHTQIKTFKQRPGMTPDAREQFIADVSDETPSVGFAVLGGVFSEGIDLPGDKLIGVFVATLGLPPHDDLHEVLRERLQQRYGDGYGYTYLYPGLQKVVQAAGRLIRTPQDSGVIELIDDRYRKPALKRLLPKWWQQSED
jgi:DNA excision repair protein ERCC-2